MSLNCLHKISEKVIVTRLSHFVERLSLLHNEQRKDEKNRFAIDAFLCLLHDIQTTKISKNIFSCHVSTKRSIPSLRIFKMSNQLIR